MFHLPLRLSRPPPLATALRRTSAANLLRPADRICLPRGRLSFGVCLPLSFHLMAPQQITFICAVKPVMFPGAAPHLKISIWFHRNPFVQSAATSRRVLKGHWPLWLPFWDYVGLSYGLLLLVRE